jgi:hypothetical protein
MCLHGKWLAGAYAKRLFQTLRHRAKSASGMLARSACASMANGWRALNCQQRMVKTAQVLRNLNENFFDFFDFVVK